MIVNNTQEVSIEICANSVHTISISMFCTEQKWDKTCKKLVSQICHGNRSNFKSVTMYVGGILQKHQYVHGLQHDITAVPHSLVPTTLHDFHDSKCYQGTICTVETIRRSYWCQW